MSLHERNPEHPVTQEMQGQWHKLLAMYMHKLGHKKFELTLADIERFQRDYKGEGAVVVQSDDQAIVVRLVDAQGAAAALQSEDRRRYGAPPPRRKPPPAK